MDIMTSTAPPRRPPSTVAAGRSLDLTPGRGSGDTGPRALDHATADLRAEPPTPTLLPYAGPRRHAHLSTRALGPTTPEAA
jgi:hypothetical protein